MFWSAHSSITNGEKMAKVTIRFRMSNGMMTGALRRPMKAYLRKIKASQVITHCDWHQQNQV
jgi:hypothetical protein